MTDRSNATSVIADYIADARSRALDPHLREAALRCVLDVMAAAAAGVTESGVLAARSAALTLMQPGAIPIWFSGRTSSVTGAAWANSAASAALDLDDGHRLARGHPGAAVIPAVFAIGADLGASVDDMLTAIVIGYEVGVSVGAARLSYGNTGTWSAYAVVAAAAALRGTKPAVISHALAIAGESSPNQLFASAPPQDPPPEGSDVKEGIPWSVVTGLAALELAEEGHTGPRNILDSAAHYRFDSEAFGRARHIIRTYFKLYACCRHIHAPIDALLALMSEHDIDAGTIDSILVETYGGALRISNKSEPANLVDVQYSIPYCLGLVALRGPDALLPLNGAALGDVAATALARNVAINLDQAIDREFPAQTLARLTVRVGGRDYRSAVTAPRGEADHPLSWSDLEAKLNAAARLTASAEDQAKLLAGVEGLRAGDMELMSASLKSEFKIFT